MKETLKSARLKCGMNLHDAALQIGVSRKTLKSWENYKSYPTIVQLQMIESTYHIKYDDIVFLPPNDT